MNNRFSISCSFETPEKMVETGLPPDTTRNKMWRTRPQAGRAISELLLQPAEIASWPQIQQPQPAKNTWTAMPLATQAVHFTGEIAPASTRLESFGPSNLTSNHRSQFGLNSINAHSRGLPKYSRILSGALAPFVDVLPQLLVQKDWKCLLSLTIWTRDKESSSSEIHYWDNP